MYILHFGKNIPFQLYEQMILLRPFVSYLQTTAYLNLALKGQDHSFIKSLCWRKGQ